MTDFDTLLHEALTDGAERAPGVAGVATAARERARARRNRRVAVGASAAVLAIGVPIGVMAGSGDGRTQVAGPSPGTATSSATADVGGAWQTHTYEGVTFSVPADWHSMARGRFLTYRPDSVSVPLTTGLSFLYSAVFDPAQRPGDVGQSGDDGAPLWSGYVYAGDWAIDVATPNLGVTRQILASVHETGQPEVDGSAWETFSRDGISWQLPAGWGLGAGADLAGYGVCATEVPGDGPRSSPVESQVDRSHYRIEREIGDHMVTIVAPTRAVADLVLGTVSDAADAPEGECAIGP